MNPITDCELAKIQADVASAALDKTALVERPTVTRGGKLNPAESYTTIATALACGLKQPSAGQLTTYADLIGSQASWMVSFAVGANVRKLDRLTIDGQVMIVQVALTPQSYSVLDSFLATAVK